MNMIQEYVVALKPIAFFRQSEQVDLDNVELVMRMIRARGSWLEPIAVDREHGIVMDGNHRLCAARYLGLQYVPCVLVDYADPGLTVLDWTTGAPFDIDSIYRTVLAQRLFPHKTTRHLFSPGLPRTDVGLARLERERAPARAFHLLGAAYAAAGAR